MPLQQEVRGLMVSSALLTHLAAAGPPMISNRRVQRVRSTVVQALTSHDVDG